MPDHGPLPPSDASAPIERRLATILCADVANYSRMMGEDEERTVQVFRGHREVFESLVALHRGRIFNTAGDALLAEFNSAVEAVRCATEIQAALGTRNESLRADQRLQFRIGINLGDVIVQGDDLLGDGVNVAARIQTATQPGGVCISGSVFDQIQNKLSLSFTLVGEQTYKNIARPVRTYALGQGSVGVAAASARRAWPKAAAGLAAGLALVGAAIWGYRQYEAGVAERARLQAELTSQLAQQKQATERALAAADAAKRAADARAAEDDRRRAGSEAARRAAAASTPASATHSTAATAPSAPPPPVKPTTPPSPGAPATASAAAPSGATAVTKKPTPPSDPGAPAAKAKSATPSLDGIFNGSLCNLGPDKAPTNCWRVVLIVRGGIAEGSWFSVAKRTSKATGTVAADGALELKIAGWTRTEEPNEAVLTGRVTADAIAASGKWRRGGGITGEWKRADTTATAAAARPALASHDGTYPGRICNLFKDPSTPPHCWPVSLTVRAGHIDASWGNPKRTSNASGTVTAEGAIDLKLSGWTRQGDPVEGMLVGRIAQGVITASGQWRNGGTMAADWKRAE